jgi:hypothetical protein
MLGLQRTARAAVAAWVAIGMLAALSLGPVPISAANAKVARTAAKPAHCPKHLRRCHEGGVPTSDKKKHAPRRKPVQRIGGGVPPDQYLPFATGTKVRVSQGAQMPCGRGFDHVSPRCNGYYGPYNQWAWDFAVKSGTPIRAAIGGTVLVAGSVPGGYGNTVLIRTARGDCSRYEHLSTIGVRVGQQVAAYDLIARSGNTGFSTGPHLHYGREDCRNHYSVQSAFIDAGDPKYQTTVTSGNRVGPSAPQAPAQTVVCPPDCAIYGASEGVKVRKGPSTGSGVLTTLPNRHVVHIVCQTSGDSVGGSPIWDQIDGGGYVADYYVNTPVTGGYSPGVGQCGSPATINPGNPGGPVTAPQPVLHYNCTGTPSPFGHYVPVGRHWGNDFIAQGSSISGGYLLLGANPAGGDHRATIGIYTGGPTPLSGALGEVTVSVSGYGGVNFTFPKPIAVSSGQSLWVGATGIGNFTAYDQNNGGADGCLIGRLDGTI